MNRISFVTLEDWICLQNFELNLRVLVADGGQVLEDQLGALRLPRSRLPADHHALVLSENQFKVLLIKLTLSVTLFAS